MSYKDIDNYLDSIKPKAMVVTINACHQETALEPLKEGPSPRVVLTMPSDWFYATSKNYKNEYIASLPEQFDPIEPQEYDIDNNGYVSIKESYETQMKSMQRYLSEHPEQAIKYGTVDLHNVSAKLYFGDFKVDPNNQDQFFNSLIKS